MDSTDGQVLRLTPGSNSVQHAVFAQADHFTHWFLIRRA